MRIESAALLAHLKSAPQSQMFTELEIDAFKLLLREACPEYESKAGYSQEHDEGVGLFVCLLDEVSDEV